MEREERNRLSRASAGIANYRNDLEDLVQAVCKERDESLEREGDLEGVLEELRAELAELRAKLAEVR